MMEYLQGKAYFSGSKKGIDRGISNCNSPEAASDDKLSCEAN